MANDRLYLYCNICEERLLLYKYYPANGYVPPETLATMDEWLDTHAHECNKWAGDLNPYLFSIGNEDLWRLRECMRVTDEPQTKD